MALCHVSGLSAKEIVSEPDFSGPTTITNFFKQRTAAQFNANIKVFFSIKQHIEQQTWIFKICE